MADLAPVAASVKASDPSTAMSWVKAGETITQGQSIYYDAAALKYKLADASASGTAVVTGISVTPAVTDGYFWMVTTGAVDLGVTLTDGEIYVVSDTPGKIMPESDLTTGEWVSIIGVAKGTSDLIVNINVVGTQIP